MHPRVKTALVGLLLAAAGCSSRQTDAQGDEAPPAGPVAKTTNTELVPAGSPSPPPTERDRDILSTKLAVDLPTKSATATLRIATGEAGASFEAEGLDVRAVRDESGPLEWRMDDGTLHVAAPAIAATIVVEYAFADQAEFQGAKDGRTLTWPYWCGRVFPCDSNPADGMRFELSVTTAPGAQSVYAPSIPAEAPSYMLAWATGELATTTLGKTDAGTQVSVWYPPASKDAVLTGTKFLVAEFDWLERTYGDYLYGDEVGTVVVDWGAGALGGMEHHPFWHVDDGDADDISVHTHEAAHGWYGNGVRMQCWEDFVLSEGTVTYMATRAAEEIEGAQAGKERWASHQERLDGLQESERKKIAWPKGCNEVDILEDQLFGPAPYVKGAFFLKAVGEHVGVERLDQLLREFYLAHRGTAVRFQQLLDAIKTQTGYDPQACAEAWLRQDEVPTSGC